MPQGRRGRQAVPRQGQSHGGRPRPEAPDPRSPGHPWLHASHDHAFPGEGRPAPEGRGPRGRGHGLARDHARQPLLARGPRRDPQDARGCPPLGPACAPRAGARRGGPRRRARQPGRQEDPPGRLPRPRPRSDLHLHAVPAPRILPAHVPELRGGREGAGRRARPPGPDPPALDQLRSGARHPGGAEALRPCLRGGGTAALRALGVRPGSDAEIRRLGGFLGLDYDPDQGMWVHNLRTAVVGPDGTLVRSIRGSDWKPEQLVADLRAAAGATKRSEGLRP